MNPNAPQHVLKMFAWCRYLHEWTRVNNIVDGDGEGLEGEEKELYVWFQEKLREEPLAQSETKATRLKACQMQLRYKAQDAKAGDKERAEFRRRMAANDAEWDTNMQINQCLSILKHTMGGWGEDECSCISSNTTKQR